MPPGRSKTKNSGKKQVAKQSALLLSAALDQSSLNQDLILQLLHADQPACSIYTSGHTNRKDNPNCFCGLIPKPNSHKKKGLWQAKPAVLSALGADPNDIRRTDENEPCGLANLGNTCYVSSALQCLFMIPEFRNALYRVEESLASTPIVAELRELFAHLQWGPRSYVDPAAFARSLNLETHVQQDGQEFMKLLLSKLESLFKQSSQKEVREVVPALFKGAYRFVTQCKACGRESQSSANLIDFYELPLQVQRYSSVAESLSSFLAPELLEGDNQYFCEGCLGKVDASRQTVLHQLPPYLCLALQRFMFNFETMTKQKAMDKFSFPPQLDFGAFMPSSTAADHLYELVAVQIHKGNSASHGHYVAHVRDSRDVWWRFDDTEVTKLGSTPASHTGDHGSTNAASTSGNNEKQKDAITSSNAYMLLYKLKGWQYQQNDTGASDVAVGTGGPADAEIPPGVVAMVGSCREGFAKECNKYEETKEKAEREITTRQQFVREVLETCTVVNPTQERCYWISTAWLEAWANCEGDCEPIDNSPLLCQHNKLDSSKVSLMKCVNEGTWLRLQEKYKGGPELTTQDVCTLCLDSKKQGAHDAQLAQQIREELDRLDKADKKKNEDSDDKEDNDTDGFYVSATWLRGWRRNKSIMATQPPTASLTCPHGRLAPEASSSTARRTVVSAHVWNALTYLWKRYVDSQTKAAATVQKDNGKGGQANGHNTNEVVELMSDASDVEILASPGPATPELTAELVEFPVLSSNECEECAASLGIAKQEHTRSKLEMADARKELGNLAAGVQITLQPGEHYYLVPSVWLAAWRSRVNAPKRTTVGVPTPQSPLCPVSEALAAFLCPCHSNPHRLATELPVLEVTRNNKCCQSRPAADEMTLISADDWRSLWEFCLLHTTPTNTSADEEQEQKSRVSAVEAGVKAWVIMVQTDQQASDTSGKLDVQDAGPQPPSTSGKGGLGNGQEAASTSKPASKEAKQVVVLHTDPPVCSEWRTAQEHARKAAALNYTQRDIIVQVATEDELPSLTSQKGERRSKRSRRGRAVLQLDSTCTLEQLKLHIFQHLGIHPINADIYIKGVRAESEELSLAQLEVYPEEELLVVHAGRTCDDDYVSLLGDGTGVKAREVEMGFKNTALAETPAATPEPPPTASTPQEETGPPQLQPANHTQPVQLQSQTEPDGEPSNTAFPPCIPNAAQGQPPGSGAVVPNAPGPPHPAGTPIPHSGADTTRHIIAAETAAVAAAETAAGAATQVAARTAAQVAAGAAAETAAGAAAGTAAEAAAETAAEAAAETAAGAAAETAAGAAAGHKRKATHAADVGADCEGRGLGKTLKQESEKNEVQGATRTEKPSQVDLVSPPRQCGAHSHGQQADCQPVQVELVSPAQQHVGHGDVRLAQTTNDDGMMKDTMLGSELHDVKSAPAVTEAQQRKAHAGVSKDDSEGDDVVGVGERPPCKMAVDGRGEGEGSVRERGVGEGAVSERGVGERAVSERAVGEGGVSERGVGEGGVSEGAVSERAEASDVHNVEASGMGGKSEEGGGARVIAGTGQEGGQGRRGGHRNGQAKPTGKTQHHPAKKRGSGKHAAALHDSQSTVTVDVHEQPSNIEDVEMAFDVNGSAEGTEMHVDQAPAPPTLDDAGPSVVCVDSGEGMSRQVRPEGNVQRRRVGAGKALGPVQISEMSDGGGTSATRDVSERAVGKGAVGERAVGVSAVPAVALRRSGRQPAVRKGWEDFQVQDGSVVDLAKDD